MTTHVRLAEWVKEVAGLCNPDQIHWCDGSPEEYQLMLRLMVQAGTAMPMDPVRPNSIFVRSDPADVARVEDRTYICSSRKEDAGPTNNWMDPEELGDVGRYAQHDYDDLAYLGALQEALLWSPRDRDLWRAGCAETCTSGSEGGCGETESGQPGHRAPPRPY